MSAENSMISDDLYRRINLGQQHREDSRAGRLSNLSREASWIRRSAKNWKTGQVPKLCLIGESRS